MSRNVEIITLRNKSELFYPQLNLTPTFTLLNPTPPLSNCLKNDILIARTPCKNRSIKRLKYMSKDNPFKPNTYSLFSFLFVKLFRCLHSMCNALAKNLVHQKCCYNIQKLYQIRSDHMLIFFPLTIKPFAFTYILSRHNVPVSQINSL